MRSLLLALILTPIVAASPLPDFPFVYVYGAAQRDTAPDKAVINLQVKSYDAQADRAYKKQSETADALLAFAEKLGVPTDAIVAQAIYKTTVRKEDGNGKQLEVIGYEVVRSVEIQLKELTRFPLLIELLYGLANVEGISVTFGCKDEGAILQNLTDDACRVAKENAERLSKGFQQKLGGVYAISENGFSSLGSAFGTPGEPGYGYGGGNSHTVRDFRSIPSTITFRKGIYAIFRIE